MIIKAFSPCGSVTVTQFLPNRVGCRASLRFSPDRHGFIGQQSLVMHSGHAGFSTARSQSVAACFKRIDLNESQPVSTSTATCWFPLQPVGLLVFS